MIDTVFFDAGETLLRPYPSFPELFARTCAREGFDIDPETVRSVQEGLSSHMIEVSKGSASLSAEASLDFWTYFYRRLLHELGLPEHLAESLYETFSDSRSYKLFDDVRPALERLAADGYRLGLISNFEGWLEKMLVELEVGHVFDVSVISGVVGVEKPDPRIYEIALKEAGVPASQCVHIGDSIRADMRPAREAGMHAVLIDRPGHKLVLGDVGLEQGEGRSEAWPTISTLEELPQLIAKL